MILVTGGAGFIGSVLVGELNSRGMTDILIVDRLSDSPKWKNIRNLKFTEYVHADELFLPEYSDLLEKVSFIFHIGACSSTTEMDMDFLMKNNVLYSKNLFELARDLKVPFIYASSAATYGDGEQGYDDDQDKISHLKPLNPYGYSKQLFDEWVLKHEDRPSHWFGLKYFNVFGPNEYHKEDMSSLVFKAYHQILESGKVRLFKSHRDGYEDGKQLRDFVYVKDIVNAMLEMMDAKHASSSGIYNMGTGQANSFYDLAVYTFKAMGKEPNIEFFDMPERLRKQYQYYTQANMEKLKTLLPEFTFNSLEHSVKDYVTNYLMKEDPHYNG